MEYPEKMKNDQYFWLWQPKYYRLMKKKQQFNAIIAGAPGTGKSWLALGIGELFNPDFKPSESVCFSAIDFANRVADYKKFKKGSVLILDDAGLSAMSSEAMTREVRAISKTLQSIRHRSLVVLLTVPSLQLLAKSTKILSDYYMRPLRWDTKNHRTVCKFHKVSFDAITGKAYYPNSIRFKKFTNPVTGFTSIDKEKVLAISVPVASKHITKEYEQYKRERMREFDTENAEKLNNDKAMKKQVSADKIAKQVAKKRDDFMANGRVSHELIALKYGIGKTKSRDVANMVKLMGKG